MENKMEVNATLILDVWELISECLPTNKKEDVAIKLIKIFIDKGFEQDDLESIKGEDLYLDSAIDSFNEGEFEESDDYNNDYDDD
jgi:hypothetical protein